MPLDEQHRSAARKPAAQIAASEKAAATKASNTARTNAAALISTPGLTADEAPPAKAANPHRRQGDRASGDDDAASALDVWLSFDDLRRAGIVDSWKTLGEWQRDPRIGFPLGRLLAPNTRRWSETEVTAWLASRPVERKSVPPDAVHPRVRDKRRAAAEAQS